MSIYDQIARGIEPIGRDLPQIAQMFENRNRYNQLRDFQREQFEYQKSRDTKAETRQFNEEQLAHALSRIEWALQSESPKAALLSDPEAVKQFAAQGVDINQLDDAQARKMLQVARGRVASQLGVRPDAAKSRGAPVKVNKGGKPVYEYPDEAVGQEAYTGDEAGGGAVNKQLITRPVAPGMVQDFAWDPRSNKRVPASEPYPDPGKGGGESTAPENLIWRQVVNAYGGLYDPTTGEFSITDPDSRASAQRVAADASRIYRDGGGQITPSEATNRALAREKSRGAADSAEAGTLPPAAAARLKPGVVTTFANGQKWTLQDGKPVRVP